MISAGSKDGVDAGGVIWPWAGNCGLTIRLAGSGRYVHPIQSRSSCAVARGRVCWVKLGLKLDAAEVESKCS